MINKLQPVVKVIRLGHEAEPVVIIDNFAADAAALVDTAAATVMEPAGSSYPGLRSAVPGHYASSVGPLVATAMRHVFGFEQHLSFDRALFALITTSPAELSLAQRIPHVDGVRTGMMAIVHYLSQEDLGGTSFYRHRSTGFETVTNDRHRTYLDALSADLARDEEPPASYIAGDTAMFMQIGTVQPVFNRAIIYRSCLLHCADIRSADMLSAAPRTGRLTITSFLTAR